MTSDAGASCCPSLPGFTDGHWFGVSDKDLRALGLYRRHYSSVGNRLKPRQQAARRDGRNGGIAGTGDYLALMTPDCLALFVWKRHPGGVSRGGEVGVNCSVFRNEGPVRSSLLIEEACVLAWARWPGERLFTYVHPGRVRSTNPGYCFLMAGWRKAGVSKRGLILLERVGG